MRRFILVFISLAVIGVQLAFAQSFVVKGKVTSDDGGESLIGVSILQEGSANGVVTDLDGNYSIEIKGLAKATLKFSYIGMQSQQHIVTGQAKVLNVVMKSDAQLMDEVVVVAYGVRKKEQLRVLYLPLKQKRWRMFRQLVSTRLCRGRRRV